MHHWFGVQHVGRDKSHLVVCNAWDSCGLCEVVAYGKGKGNFASTGRGGTSGRSVENPVGNSPLARTFMKHA